VHGSAGLTAKVAFASQQQVAPKDVARLFWAAAVLNVASTDALDNMRQLGASLRPEDLDRDALARLFQAHMALAKLMVPSARGSAGRAEQEQPLKPLLPGEVLAHAEAAWRCHLHSGSETEVCTSRQCIHASLASPSPC
jgi:hypothetical protein